VYRVGDDLAVVQTLDFFTPIVDDPFTFGKIAAANALSDVYAMGGKPLTAMNIVAFPMKELGMEVLHEILKGGLEKINEAGAALVGGHSIEDKELKYGLSVTGVVHPSKVVTNEGMRPGDRLVLTKPLGTGIVNTALKRGAASAEVVAEVEAAMARLNRAACEAMVEIGVNACTDVTGYALLGHLAEMVERSGCGAELYVTDVPLFPETRAYAEKGMVPGGTGRNRKFREGMVEGADRIPKPMMDVLYDPQTSGGLLIAVSFKELDALIERLVEKGVAEPAVVGEVIDKPKGKIVLRA
jgi:selenide,water dikinase